MVEYENEHTVENRELIPSQVESDVGVGAEGVKVLSTGEAIALVGLAAFGTAWFIEKAVKFGKWIGTKVDEHRKSKALRQPEADKPVEPTDEQIVEAATE